MADSRSDEVLRPYREAVERHGAGFEATLWGSRETQRLRFDVMLELVPLDGCAIADVGCGPGGFAAHLIERKVSFERYLGVDALPEVIAKARESNLPRCTFEVRDVLDGPLFPEGAYDYACLSGTLNTMDEATARRLVGRCYEHAAQGVIFNFLSNRPHARWADRDLTPARRFDTVAWIDWALGLSPRVSFTQEYLDGHDATILIRRG